MSVEEILLMRPRRAESALTRSLAMMSCHSVADQNTRTGVRAVVELSGTLCILQDLKGYEINISHSNMYRLTQLEDLNQSKCALKDFRKTPSTLPETAQSVDHLHGPADILQGTRWCFRPLGSPTPDPTQRRTFRPPPAPDGSQLVIGLWKDDIAATFVAAALRDGGPLLE